MADGGVWIGWGVSEALEGFVTSFSMECCSLRVSRPTAGWEFRD